MLSAKDYRRVRCRALQARIRTRIALNLTANGDKTAISDDRLWRAAQALCY
jgi:hypothetical protein